MKEEMFCHFERSACYNDTFLALGSNLGNRFTNIQNCAKLIQHKIGRVLCTSQIYESPCFGENQEIILNQNYFLNAVIRVDTKLSPESLLIQCKDIELLFKRKDIKEYYHEPRAIDIDILLYNQDIIDTEVIYYGRIHKLFIPHLKISERLFVLKLLLDIDKEITIPPNKTSVVDIIEKITKTEYSIKFSDKIGNLKKTFNIASSNNDRPELNFNLGDRTLIMAIVNCTPDSFAGGQLGHNCSEEYEKIVNDLLKVKDKFDIIDIGGESTRPGALEVNESVELERVTGVIKRIRNTEELKDKPISIDTRKSSVARKCLELGASIINDISGGKYDPQIIKVAEDHNVPFILVHSRSTPDKLEMKEFLHYSENIICDISLELMHRKARWNIFDWNLIIDPGIGFNKNAKQNLEIIRNLDQLKVTFPNIILLGHSKKSFIRRILKVDVNNTLPGDLAVSTIGVQKQVNIIRAHNVAHFCDCVKIADQIYKM